MHIVAGAFTFVLKAGGIGLLILGILDSSFLFAPWGNDLLVVAFTARNPHVAPMLYYAGMSAIGSTIGCWLLDITLRPLGEKGLEKYLSRRRLQRVQRRMEDHAGVTLAVSSLLPPPFPFSIFVMGAAALQYPRRRLLAVIAVSRSVRFVVVGLLALNYGERILQWGKNPAIIRSLEILIVVCLAGERVVGLWMDPAQPRVAAEAGTPGA